MAQKGVLDLRSTIFTSTKTVNLDGYWEFYWREFIPPQDFIEHVAPEPTDYFKIPNLWNNFKIKGKPIGNFGYATFHLEILLPKANILYGIELPRIETAYKLWINDQLLVQTGIPDTNADLSVPAWQIRQGYFFTKHKKVDITIQMSNFNHKKAGIAHSLKIGTEKSILHSFEYKFGFEIFMLAIVVIMALHHLGLYFLKKDDKNSLVFAFLCLSIALYITTHGQMLINYIFPDLPYELSVKLNWWSNIGSSFYFLYFVYQSFKSSFSRLLIKIFAYSYILMAVAVLILPAKYYTYGLNIFFIIAFGATLSTVWGIFTAMLRHEIGSKLLFYSSLFIFATVINDILFDLDIIQSFYSIPLGMFIFILVQSFMLALRSSVNERKIKSLNTRFSILDRIKSRLISEQNYKLNPLTQILAEELALSKAYLILQEDFEYTIIAGHDTEAKYLVDRLPLLMDNNSLKNDLPIDFIIKNSDDYKNSCFLKPDEIEESKFYFGKNQPQAVLCQNISEDKNFQLILYMEATHYDIRELNEKKTIIELLENQIYTLVENYNIFIELEELNQTLEEKVEHRTVEVFQQKEEIATQRDEIEEKNQRLQQALVEREYINRTLEDSINYAQRIQTSILPKEADFKNHFPNSFVFFRPKTKLSGDFYWIAQKEIRSGNKTETLIYVAAVDCTGHGVPGALMSIIGNNLLEQAVNEYSLSTPAQILATMEDGLQTRLHNISRVDELTKDGMDLSLIVYNTESRELKFSGAHNPAYYFPRGEENLRILEPTPLSIGGFGVKGVKKEFKQTSIQVEPNSMLYMFSDGYYDQVGGLKGRKFMKTAFRELLINVHRKKLYEQKEILDQTLKSWMSNLNQIDDILIIGIQF